MNEIELIVACKAGENKAQYELYKKYYGFLMSICLRYKNDKPSAEAALNLGFFKIITKLDKYNDKVPFTAWMHRIMINTLIDEYRKEKRNKEMFDYDENYLLISDKNSSELNLATLNFDTEELTVMIKSLSEVTQKVFNLYAIDGYKHVEIAKILNIKEGTSRWHLSTARKELKAMVYKSLNQNKVTTYGR